MTIWYLPIQRYIELTFQAIKKGQKKFRFMFVFRRVSGNICLLSYVPYRRDYYLRVLLFLREISEGTIQEFTK